MTVEEVIQEQRKLLLKLKKSVSTLISVDQCGWADNILVEYIQYNVQDQSDKHRLSVASFQALFR